MLWLETNSKARTVKTISKASGERWILLVDFSVTSKLNGKVDTTKIQETARTVARTLDLVSFCLLTLSFSLFCDLISVPTIAEFRQIMQMIGP